MKTRRLFPIVVFVLAFLCLGAQAFAQANQRPIEDFINAQVGTGFFWTDPPDGLNMEVDYLGRLNAFVVSHGGPDAGTTFDGKVTERALKGGGTQVDVSLHTHNAISYAFSNVLLLGYTANEILLGKPEALGDSLLTVSFVSDQPVGGKLPNLTQLYFAPRPGQQGGKLSFVASASGALRLAFGVPEGTPGRAHTTQRGLYGVPGQGIPPDQFPAEKIDIQEVGQ